MNIIDKVYSYFDGNLGCLSNKNYFFTFFSVIVHQMFGINGFKISRNVKFSENFISENIDALYSRCGNFLNDYTAKVSDISSGQTMEADWAEFKRNHSARTTSKKERISRISFMSGYFMENKNGEQ